ncbi:lantibiotic dehydratase family protein [Streptomyces sp. Go40/10]|uniref:lantibiotic dehydratase n=1 Tax=Streptomyces sp. Go40/10 TaxID=2825844 RepID=UPI001E64CDE1|nr:lantibiotic dehydratase [Streptomyces sp. Go40/10]UFQ99977.1 lantibiotic dehydratase family protein [Streptomyces sp. Go40/10]
MSYPVPPAAPVRVPPPDRAGPSGPAATDTPAAAYDQVGRRAPADPYDEAGRCDPADPYARMAPYALVRTTALAYPAESAPSAAVRTLLARLTVLAARDTAVRAALCEDLFAARGAHDEDFHRRVVLPLRRALHNGREPRPALLGRLGTLPERVPRLAEWLALRELRAGLSDELGSAVPRALAAEREALAGLCRSSDFARAIALTSADLLRAVNRAGEGAHGRRVRKEEASVLRHALRASTKTSPLSWLTAVGWAAGPFADTAADADADAETADAETADADTAASGPEPSAAPISVVKENRTLVTALTAALLDEPRRRRALPHRLTSTARVADGRARFARAEALFAGGRYLVSREDSVEVVARPALGTLAAALADGPLTLGTLTARLAAGLGRTTDDCAVTHFVDRLADSGLLVPAEPVDPQHPAPLLALADWLGQWPADASLADRITRLAHDTARFSATPATERPALLTTLTGRWHELLADAGRPVAPDAAPLTVLTEDVVTPVPLSPRRPPIAPHTEADTTAPPYEDRAAGYDPFTSADHTALTELTSLAELFDLGHVMSRVARDRFVARYGEGGVCRDPWDFGADTAAAWEESGRHTARPSDDPALPTGLAELTRLREEFTGLARKAAGPAGETAAEVVLPAGPVRALAARLPDWTAARPLSYSLFVQRAHEEDLLCVNHVYGGWGRFTSRFLDALPASAAAAVGERLRRGLGGARAAQIRPVGGFNANLHPLLLAEEIGPDHGRTSLAEADVDLVHDAATDRLRFRVRATGDLLDVLYLGFLAPVMLPQRLAPYLCDHPAGVVDFRPLLPRHVMDAPGGPVVRTPRLRHRHLVLARCRWHLGPAALDALRADLAAEQQEVPVAAVTRWRALLDLPEQLFVHPVPQPPAGHAVDDFVARLQAPKPQALDLGNALHLRCLGNWLARHPRGVVLEEALPVFGGRDRPARAVESVVETYRPARRRTAACAAPADPAPSAPRRGGTR